MKTIKIRDLRGAKLEAAARSGELVGLTRDRALIAILIPMAQAWLEHVVDQNWSRIVQSVNASQENDPESALVTLDDALAQAVNVGTEQSSTPASNVASAHIERFASSLGLVDTSATELVRRLSVAFGLSKPGDADAVETTTIGVRDISAHRIERASEEHEILIITNDRVLLGMLVPVSQRLVEFLITQNLSRITYNVRDAEERISSAEELATLDDVLAESESAGGEQPSEKNAHHGANH